MTVNELIRELQNYDGDMEVLINDDNWNEPICDIDEVDGSVLIWA